MTFLTNHFKKYYLEYLFSLGFIYVYLPFFIYFNFPLIHWDSHAYLLVAYDFQMGNIPLDNYTIDLPIGLSTLIWLCFKLGGSLGSVIFIQTLLYLISAIFLLKQVKSISIQLAQLFAIFLFLFVTLSDSLLYNFMLF